MLVQKRYCGLIGLVVKLGCRVSGLGLRVPGHIPTVVGAQQRTIAVAAYHNHAILLGALSPWAFAESLSLLRIQWILNSA